MAIRSAELHTYRPGGSVADPQHRDCGSLVTLSVLLSPPADYSGAQFMYWRADAARGTEEVLRPALGRGDGVLFASEKRHNVTPLLTGRRRSFVLELWAGATNQHNRHR